ncbi:hypothetical protein [Azospirillum rugosum]|uniref:PH domain-containing protein n=1 Tax=Azospirillum rugosum TaxID=416170 RepID=A0ABS4SMX9_9PROT|nr:hypothetical protein [Azospirillum rugosum]MBP2293909.1 hypothetical protein [Azospirillum rugosum]MDQ0526904.1 hypothetical protein [Azospirillum rugosum]
MAETLRYPPNVLLGDYARAMAGLALTALPLALLQVTPWIAGPLALCALLFAVFALRTAQRQMTRVTMDEEALRAEGPLGATIRWDALSDLRLRYYATKRGRDDGWMQATLIGRGSTIRIDSNLDGFDAVIERAVTAVRTNGLRLSRVTIDNLLALGITPPEPLPEDTPS